MKSLHLIVLQPVVMGVYLAMGGGERKAEVRASHNNQSGTHLNGETTGRSNLGELDTNSRNNGVPVCRKTEYNAESTDEENPNWNIRLLAERLLAVHVPDGSEGANSVGNIVSTVSEGIAAGCEYLQNATRVHTSASILGIDSCVRRYDGARGKRRCELA
jgi:hypothetical protein